MTDQEINSPSATPAPWLGIVGYIRVRGRTSVHMLIVRRHSRDARHSLVTKITIPARSRTLLALLRRLWPETAWPAQAPHVLRGLMATRSATTGHQSLRRLLHRGPCRCRRALRWWVPTECNTDTWEIHPCLPTCATTCTLVAPPLQRRQVSPATSGRPLTPRPTEQRLQRHWSRASRTGKGLAALLEAPT